MCYSSWGHDLVIERQPLQTRECKPIGIKKACLHRVLFCLFVFVFLVGIFLFFSFFHLFLLVGG